MKEVELGILSVRGRELAEILGADVAKKKAERWNALCQLGRDEDFGTRVDVAHCNPPYYGAPVWATVSNTKVARYVPNNVIDV